MTQKWTKVLPYGKDAYAYWFSGIYKIVSYTTGQYHAYLIENGDKNWGNHVAEPPETFQIGNGMSTKGYKTLKDAQQACDRHSKSGYEATPKTIARAAEIQAAVIEDAKQYA